LTLPELAIILVIPFSQGAAAMCRFHHRPARKAAMAGLGLLAFIVMSPPTSLADEPKKGLLGAWKDTAELSYVVTGGNSSTSTFSVGNTLKRTWNKNALTIKAFALSSHATTITRTAQGTQTDYTLIEQKQTSLVAENVALSGLYSHSLSKKVILLFGLGWDRNRFAGVAGRVIMTAGTGYAWVETKQTILKTDGGLTYTWRKYFSQSAASFGGFRGIVTFEQKIIETSSFTSQFIFDENLKRMVDWRYDWTNSLTASIAKALALKTSLRLLYAHLPANQAVPLIDPNGVPTGLTVPVPLKRLDTIFTTSVVINF
jgi:putative salt-induced outer membrane protein YdiY